VTAGVAAQKAPHPRKAARKLYPSKLHELRAILIAILDRTCPNWESESEGAAVKKPKAPKKRKA
jgi:hypothetical protein